MADTKGSLPAAATNSNEQPTLRVMRLYKPRLDAPRRVLPLCSVDKYHGVQKSDGPASADGFAATGGGGSGEFALSSALKLPDSFGNIYLGETFTAYISVLNHLPATALANATLSAKLQSPSVRVDLADKRMARGASSPMANPAPVLEPSENLDMIVEHTLEELGTHTLRVTVQFEVVGGQEGAEPRSMRKFYRFMVMNPVDMSYVCTSVKGTPLVELQLRNTTQMDILLESCDFIPEEGVMASLIDGGVGTWHADSNARRLEQPPPASDATSHAFGQDTASTGDAPQATVSRRRWWERGEGTRRSAQLTGVQRFDGRVLLCPHETHQLMYAVRAASSSRAPGGGEGEIESEHGQSFGDGSHTFGQVKLSWRTTMGETGSIRSSPVVFEAPSRPEVEVTIDGLPHVLMLGRVAACFATVHNRSSRPMTLQLQFRTDGMVGVYVHGQSFRNLGELAPGTSKRCPLQLLALVAGLHEVRGCTVADMHTAQEFPQGNLRDVLVEFPADDDTIACADTESSVSL